MCNEKKHMSFEDEDTAFYIQQIMSAVNSYVHYMIARKAHQEEWSQSMEKMRSILRGDNERHNKQS